MEVVILNEPKLTKANDSKLEKELHNLEFEAGDSFGKKGVVSIRVDKSNDEDWTFVSEFKKGKSVTFIGGKMVKAGGIFIILIIKMQYFF